MIWPGGRLELATGRVLQVSLQGNNAFWTADSTDWNIGGDRLWLGPERDWFWVGDDPDDLTKHIVPPEIDPGKWHTVHIGPRRAEFKANPVLRHRRTRARTRVHVRREIFLRHADATRAIYDVRTSLEVQWPGQEVSAWTVLQVPTGGVLEFSLAGPFGYRDYLRPVDSARFATSEDHVSIRLTGQTMDKFGVRPDVFAGRLRYVSDALIIERQVDVQPRRRYCDHPLGADPAGQGDALQVFEDDGHYGGYAEIEHHSPAARRSAPVVDVCRTVITLR
jgi:hypothetical protein